ncbi:GC-rich sequence DNA-binding factor 2 isoform X2 [Triplophysa dalaica]|uniref:GC-rich sequence DNA-binding factor 2 isoform X2 n=1 Tax=Triplophysa dalaica TaxID=1582913 RepID=UPI0024E035AC|nr:GC-rich sequence DNA-binding factor 2 isoform X2 [Triplophysa dalaica]
MFNKKPRRNFRQRKDESSEEEENEKVANSDATKETEKPIHFSTVDLARRGFSSGSKSRRSDSSDAEEPAVTSLQSKDNNHSSKTNTLSFLEDKDCTEGSSFRVKRAVNKEVLFQARKKEDPAVPLPSSQVKKKVDLGVQSDSDAEDVLHDSDDGSSSTISSLSSSSSSSKPQTVTIPDARKIHAAKEQRRQARARKDYIPLDSPSTPGSLMEEDRSEAEQNSDDEPDDHERRIEFAPKPKTLRERMAEKMESDSEESFSDSQEEEDQHIWEEQQIGKGVSKHQKRYQAPVRQKRKTKLDIPETPPAVSINVIKKRIVGKLDSLREVHRAREAELRRIQLDVEMAKSSLESLENHPADEQLCFYRTMNIFSQNLLECLSEKMALINWVELDMHSLYIDQAEALLSQRREEVQEESTRIQKLTYNTDSQSNGDATGGSSPALQSLLDFSEEECLPSDWEPATAQEAELQSKRADLLKRSQEIFADVQTEFWDVKKILSRFDEWRVSFPESYNNAYIGLCLPKLLAPLIRHQLIGWNPLKAEGEDFEALPWYSAVERFCHGQGYEESENMDMKTLPTISEKTILSKVQGFVELVWDPLSSQQSNNLTTLCKRIQDDYSVFDGEQSKPVKAFVEAVIQRLRTAVDNDVFVPLYPKKSVDDRRSPQFLFQNKQFYSAVKLLGNMALWDGLIPEQILKELMLEKLLGRYLMITVLNDSSPKHTIQKCKKIADCFPTSWFMDVNIGSSLPQLQNFRKHLEQVAHMICKDSSDPSSTRALLSEVLCLLQNIKADDSITTIINKYHCEDLLKAQWHP